MSANPFYPEMTHFTMPLHALREELVAIFAGWAAAHELFVSIERFFPTYLPAEVSKGVPLAAAIEEFEPVRRICLRHGPFDVGSVNQQQHLARNPESFVVVLEPLTEDGLRATAFTGRMGDVDTLRWWVALAREQAVRMHAGAWAVEPLRGGRAHIPDHFHTEGAHEHAARGVPMLAATGNAVFAFEDLVA